MDYTPIREYVRCACREKTARRVVLRHDKAPLAHNIWTNLKRDNDMVGSPNGDLLFVHWVGIAFVMWFIAEVMEAVKKYKRDKRNRE